MIATLPSAWSRLRRIALSRILLAVVAIAPLAACQTRPVQVAQDDESAWYIGAKPDKPFDIPLVDTQRLDPKYRRQQVSYNGPEQPGTIVVDIDKRQLVLVQADGTAMQYGVGVGKAGFSWKGEARVGRKGVWPDWSPTATMVSLHPDLPRTRKAASTTRSVPARSTCTRATATSCSGSTAPTSPGASVSRCRRAASGC